MRGVVWIFLLAITADAVKKALLVIDMQYDFMEGGSLAVGKASEIVGPINDLLALEWNAVIFSEDYHPYNSISFASSHPGKNPNDVINLTYDVATGQVCGAEYVAKYGEAAKADCTGATTVIAEQNLWPDHCVQLTEGQQTHENITVPSNAIFVKKGFTSVIDAYGVFADNFGHLARDELSDRQKAAMTENALEFWLQGSGIEEVYVVGLAYDFCVKFTALQAKRRQFKTFVVADASRSVFPANDDDTKKQLEDGGVTVTDWNTVKDNFVKDTTQRKESKAMIIIDMQNDFVDSGNALNVEGANDIIDPINKLTALSWDAVIFSEDFHPVDSISFASMHDDASPSAVQPLEYGARGRICYENYDNMSLYGKSSIAACGAGGVSLNQTLWPNHCVQGTSGQLTHKDMTIPDGSIFVKKGFTTVIDSYGVFGNNFEHEKKDLTDEEKLRSTENALQKWLEDSNVKEVYIAGLAFDFCVKYSAIQAQRRGFKTFVVVDAAKPVSADNIEATKKELTDAGVTLITVADTLAKFPSPSPSPAPSPSPSPATTPAPSGGNLGAIIGGGAVAVILILVGAYFMCQPGADAPEEGDDAGAELAQEE